MRTRQKILLCVQYSAGDCRLAEQLIDLYTEVTRQANGGAKSPHADLLLSAAADTTIDYRVVQRAGLAFDHVRTFRCRRQIVGWPHGPNGQMRDTLAYFATRKWGYSAIWLTEPDCLPLAADFIAQVHAEWASTNRLIMGCVIGQFPEGNPDGTQVHVNGNMVIAAEFPRLYPEIITVKTTIAWDAAHRLNLMHHTLASRTIYSDYKLGEPRNPWRDCGHLWREVTYFDRHPLAGQPFRPAWMHGCKDPRGLACVRERLLQK